MLLWGLRNVKNGMTRAFGSSLRDFIAQGTSNRVKAFFAGIGVTAILQSSTATALIVSSFVGQGSLSLAMGIAVMLGADVGTTLVAQILSFDLSWIAPFLMTFGFVLYSVGKTGGKGRPIGKMVMGLAFMLFALGMIKSAAVSLDHSAVLPVVMDALSKDTTMALITAAILTWLAHSSLAIILLLVSFVSAGVLSVELGLVMVIGVNLGGALVPLLSAFREKHGAIRIPLANIMMRLAGLIVFVPLVSFGVVEHYLSFLGDSPERMLVNFHTAFNMFLAIVFICFVGRISQTCMAIVPNQDEPRREGEPAYIDESQLEMPSIALSNALHETLRMADMARAALSQVATVFQNNDLKAVESVRRKDDEIDYLYKQLKMFMARIGSEELNDEDSYHHLRIMNYATNLESVGDMIDKSLMDMAEKKIRGKKSFSASGWQEILNIHKFVLETARIAESVFLSEDLSMARQLIGRKDEMRKSEAKASEAHMARIREGIAETIATSSLHLDIIRDYRRIHSYLATVAYPILEEAGHLRSRRLKAVRKKAIEVKEEQPKEAPVEIVVPNTPDGTK
jgi:phosphate:Na+ symporter